MHARAHRALTFNARPQTRLLDDDDDDIVLDDISNLLEAMDISADADDEAATAWEASELDIDSLKQALATIKSEGEDAKVTDWKAAFGENAEVTDVAVDAAAEGGGDDVDLDGDFGDAITF